jgi:hypothetical protein
MAQQPMLDVREGLVFLKTADQIRQAIKSQIGVLHTEITSFMEEVQGELEGLKAPEAAVLFLAIMANEKLNPSAMLTRRCLDRSVECQQEIAELTLICNNLQPEQNFLYKLSLEQIKRYGMSPEGLK